MTKVVVVANSEGSSALLHSLKQETRDLIDEAATAYFMYERLTGHELDATIAAEAEGFRKIYVQLTDGLVSAGSIHVDFTGYTHSDELLVDVHASITLVVSSFADCQ